MKFLHTSDWHLGRSFHGSSLLAEQRRAMERIVAIAAEQDVDAVLIAGDLYDRSVPPADAVELFDDTLHQLHSNGAAVIAISGNHDSAVRVGYADRLLERLGVTVRGDLRRVGSAVELSDGSDVPVRVYPIPYLDPLAVGHLAAEEDARARLTHHDAMVWALDAVRADLADSGPARSVVVAHTFVTGGDPCASERDLTMGNVEQVGMSAFDGIDYVALGHLHRRQAFDGGRVAYSGTPLPYSFSEQDDIKSVRLVELLPDGKLGVEQIELGVGRKLCTLTGTIDDLLQDPALASSEESRVRVVLSDPTLPLNAMRRIQERFPHAVELSHEPAGVVAPRLGAGPTSRLRDADPLDLTLEFLADRRGVPADAVERELLTESIGAVTAAGLR